MTPKEKSNLAAKLKRLLADLAADEHRGQSATKVVELDQQAVGRLSRMDALQSQAMAQAQTVRRDAEARRIQAALHRLNEDEYGYCTDCGENLETERLAIDPCLPRCLSCVRG